MKTEVFLKYILHRILCALALSLAVVGALSTIRAADAPAADDPALTRKLNSLKLIWSDVEANPVGSPKRQEYLREFQTQSASLLATMPTSHSAAGGLQTLRALAGCELNDQSQATRAGTKILELGLDKSSNELVQKTLATLERKGWLKTPQQAAEERAMEVRRLATEQAEVDAKSAGERRRKEAVEALLAKATENSLGMKFQHVPGTKLLFSIWETRVKDYELFVTETGRQWKRPSYSRDEDEFKLEPTHPAANVSWNDAKAFCEWLTRKEKKERRIDSQQEYRLPTDEEWSAAVGLTGETPTGTIFERMEHRNMILYPWGNQWPPPSGAGNFAGEEATSEYKKGIKGYSDGYVSIAPVGTFSPNQFGLYDLGGNLQELCEDTFSGKYKIVRGSSFFSDLPKTLLSSERQPEDPDKIISIIGFRVVLTAESAR
jgi:hypothetical protein